jgi:hypothetical protein
MGAAMMAPDYAWWHGFYECKKRYNNFMEEAHHLMDTRTKAYINQRLPQRHGLQGKAEGDFRQGK